MDFSAYRSKFPILQHKIHLANCSQAPQSIDTMSAVQRYWQSLEQNGMAWDYWMAEVDRARASFAQMIGADTEEIAVVGSLSDAVSSIASAMGHKDAPHVLTTMSEFPTVGHVWLAAERQKRLEVTFADSPDGHYDEGVLERHVKRNTRLISVHHVGYYDGAKQDLGRLAKFAHAHDALLFVDAYQSLGACRIDVKASGVDILASGALKYLLGVPGIAFLYVRREIAERLQPAVTGWFGRVNPFAFDVTGLDFAPGARRFQTGTPPVMAAFVARAGMDMLHTAGLDAVADKVQTLSLFTAEKARQRGLQVVSPTDPARKGPSTAIRVPDSHAVETFMATRDVIVSARGDVIRLAPHFFSLEEDILHAIEVMELALSAPNVKV